MVRVVAFNEGAGYFQDCGSVENWYGEPEPKKPVEEPKTIVMATTAVNVFSSRKEVKHAS